MIVERLSFATEEEAKVFCRAREAEEPESSWLAFQRDGKWTAVRTNLPRHEDPEGSATEAKPTPPQADDPRSAPSRNAGPYVGP